MMFGRWLMGAAVIAGFVLGIGQQRVFADTTAESLAANLSSATPGGGESARGDDGDSAADEKPSKGGKRPAGKVEDASNAVQPKHYVNTRFGFSVDFPDGWKWREGENSDGAAAQGEDGLDMRAVGHYDVLEEKLEGFIKSSLEADSTDGKGSGKIIKRSPIKDGKATGVDFTVSWTRTRKGTATGMKTRTQVFLVGDTVKYARAEAPDKVFAKNAEEIESFIHSFNPNVVVKEGQ